MLANLCQLAEWVCALRLCSWSCLRGSRLKISELWMFTDFSATMGGNLTNTASSEPQGRQTCCRGLAWGDPITSLVSLSSSPSSPIRWGQIVGGAVLNLGVE